MLVFTLDDEELRGSANGGLKSCVDTSPFPPLAAFLCRLSNVYSLCLFHVKRLWLAVDRRLVHNTYSSKSHLTTSSDPLSLLCGWLDTGR